MSTLTATQKLMRHILQETNASISWDEEAHSLTGEDIENEWRNYQEDDRFDSMYNIREGEVETELPCPYSRHYESKSVAAKMDDGSWVGWTYWYGGGKHGNPEEIEWIYDAYDLECVEEEKLVVVRTFTRTSH